MQRHCTGQRKYALRLRSIEIDALALLQLPLIVIQRRSPEEEAAHKEKREYSLFHSTLHTRLPHMRLDFSILLGIISLRSQSKRLHPHSAPPLSTISPPRPSDAPPDDEPLPRSCCLLCRKQRKNGSLVQFQIPGRFWTRFVPSNQRR